MRARLLTAKSLVHVNGQPLLRHPVTRKGCRDRLGTTTRGGRGQPAVVEPEIPGGKVGTG